MRERGAYTATLACGATQFVGECVCPSCLTKWETQQFSTAFAVRRHVVIYGLPLLALSRDMRLIASIDTASKS